MLLDQVRNTCNKFNLMPPHARVVVGVSGGPDSLALLYALKTLAGEYGFTLYAAHLDHMLRKNSAQDANFVKKTCEAIGIPLTVKKIDINRLARRGSVEEVARNHRLDFLVQTAKKYNARIIALGHNLDDQAETVIMRLMRGTGLYGLSAILPKRSIKGRTIIRPLIETKRKDIEAFLRRRGIKPRIDESNLTTVYLRNRLRLHLLPLLEKKYNKNIKTVLSHTARCVADDYDYLVTQGQKTLNSLGTRLLLEKLTGLHPAMRRLVLRLNFQRLKGDMRTLEYRHILELEDLLFNRPARSIVDLPGNISVIKDRTHIRFYKR